MAYKLPELDPTALSAVQGQAAQPDVAESSRKRKRVEEPTDDQDNINLWGD